MSEQSTNDKHDGAAPAADESRALVLTVGLAQPGDEGIINSLIQDIGSFQPRHVILLATAESAENARAIVEALAWAAERCRVVPLASPHDLADIFHKANKAIRELKTLGYDADRISINYTSGTKVMSTGLVLAATFNSCETLRYIKHGFSGAAPKSSTTSPRAVFAYRDLVRATSLFEEVRFLCARELLAGMDEDLLEAQDIRALHNLRQLATAYFRWDSFRYREALEQLSDVGEPGLLSRPYNVAEAVREKLGVMAQAVEAVRFEPLIFADMFNNAIRRCLAGNYEDAAARCYRTLEMLAQWILCVEFEIDTDNLNVRKVPARHRPDFEALRSIEDGLVRIGLRKAYELLALLGHPVGRAFWDHPDTPPMLERRRRSIMAHGLEPLRRRECEAFIRWTRELGATAIGDSASGEFDRMCRQLQFCWLLEQADRILTKPPAVSS